MGPCKQLLVHFAAAAVVALGSNVVPMEMLEARLTKEAYIALVKNAAAAGMTMLRVWGGGIFFDDAFYDACDEAGVMLYHDMMCVRIGGAARQRASAAFKPSAARHRYTGYECHDQQDNHCSLGEPIEETELQQQIGRLAAHTSIVLWSGCNECNPANKGP